MFTGISFEFMDVGMGDGTLVELPPAESGPNWLVDFGERGSPFKTPASDATLFLVDRITTNCYNRGLKTNPYLDFLVITHPDSDHWNKLDWLIEGRNADRTGL